MKKTKSYLLKALMLVCTLILSCVMLTACSEEKAIHAITWTYDQEVVTIVAEGYETLPAELEEETNLSFTVTVKDGYTLGTVAGAKKQDDGSYLLTVGNKDIDVKVNVSKTLNGITVTPNPSTKTYYDGQKIAAGDITVVANYALGDETLTESDYIITYQSGNGSSFTEGDTGFKVSFGSKSVDVALENAVKAQQVFETIGIELDENENPVFIITGYYNAEGDKATAKADVEGFFNCVKEKDTWTPNDVTANATINDDMTFTLRLSFTGARSGYYYYIQFKDASDGSDLACEVIDPEKTTVTDSKNNSYTLIQDIFEWGSHPVFLYVINTSAPVVESITLGTNANGAPTLIFTGSYAGITDSQAKAEIESTFFVDLMNLSWATRWTISNGTAEGETANFTVTAKDGKFTVVCDISKNKDGGESGFEVGDILFGHFGDSSTNMKVSEIQETSVTYNGLTYTIGWPNEECASWMNGLTILYITAA